MEYIVVLLQKKFFDLRIRDNKISRTFKYDQLLLHLNKIFS